ncbi:hypothetical protein CROQUDRAFT_651008 [Cronartium quercuum f. sp. fusiforme G11]|uniref:AB hydrolase-1 domain-containing protein n=1 Tax=Cronartium quercuum f. sp. fusiforme G11 TaxID=708437 RepID=A0A9P6NWF5_9BASI|nr:hypothetical protein CROQUDRAFT_651008 [Cronartium quercuum f. sp. fusiforme G11]
MFRPIDPTAPSSFTWKHHVTRSGHKYRYIDQNEAAKDVVLCLHGFPDLAYGWRYQILELVRRGYRVIVPDLLGYGGTSKPTEVEVYTYRSMCESISEILDHVHVKKVILLGHDWGAALSGRFLLYFPHRVRAWATICVPPVGRPNLSMSDIDWSVVVRTMFPNFGYQLYLMGDEAGEELTLYVKTFLLIVYCHMANSLPSKKARQVAAVAAAGKPSYVLEGVIRERVLGSKDVLESAEINDKETKYYVDQFKRGGFVGPVNWYKTRSLNYQEELAVRLPETYPKNVPSLFVRVTKDEALPPELSSDEQLAELFPGGNLKTVTIEGANHWVLQDPHFRDTFTTTLCDWVDIQAKTSKSHL